MASTDQKVRENPYVDDVAKTSRTVAYKESTPLDNTHLLVAQVNISTATAIPTPAGGWVERGTGGANGANQMRTYVKQGDGSTNSITIDSDSALATINLSAYAGYNGLTPILAGGSNGGNGTNFPFSGISGPAGDGVALLGIGLTTAPSSWSGWSAGTPTPALSEQPATARGWWAALDYVNGTGAANTTVSWLGTRTQRYIAVVMPLLPVAVGVTGTIASQLPSTTQTASMTVTDPASSDVSGTIASQLPATTSSMTGTVSGSGTVPAGATVPKRSEMPAAPFDLYPAPAMEWIAGAAPSGSGYISADPSNSAIRLTGYAGKGVQAGSLSGFVNPAPLQDIAGAGTGTNPLVYPPYGIRVKTDATEVYFRLGQRSYAGFSNISARAASRLKVNGKWTSLTPVYLGANLGMPANPDNISAGEYALKLTFPTTEMRELELTTHLEFGGVVVPAGSNGQTPSVPQHRLVVLDGSLTGAEKHQTGNFSLTGGSAGTYTAVSSHIHYAAQILAYDEVLNGATGSSGYSISGDTVSIKSSNKIPRDANDYSPATYLLGGPNNDWAAGQTVAQVEAALDIIMPSVNSGAVAGALKIVEGFFTAPAAGSQSSVEATAAPYNAAIKAKAQQYGWWFINPATGQTFDPQGTIRKTTSNWVYQDTSSISSDGVHPTQDGARKLGIILADAIIMAHEDDTGSPSVSAVIQSTLAAISQSMQGTVSGGGTPTPAVYGPTGGHWPDRTPKLSDTFGYDVTVTNTWANIANAITAACTTTNQGKIAVVRVAGGDLVGNGAGATSTPVMQNIGMVDRPGGRVLVIPRDGVGSVNIVTKSPRFLDVRGVSFIGFNTWKFGQAHVDGNGVLLSGCKDFAYGWAKATFWNIGNRSDVVTDRVQFVEMVANASYLYPEPDANGQGSGAADRIQWYNSTSGGTGASGTANKPEIIGCYSAPVRVWQHDDAHLDGLQIYGTGTFTDVLMKDTVLYAASHQGFISSEIANIILDHSLLIGGDTANDTQFPLEPNAATPENVGAPWPVNGAPSSAVAKNGTKLYGSPKTWPLTYDATSGQETRTSLAFLNANAPVPTDSRLMQMWSFDTAPVDPDITGTITSTLPALAQTMQGAVSGPQPGEVAGSIASVMSPIVTFAIGTVTPPPVDPGSGTPKPTVLGTAWQVNYGELSERRQFRVGQLGSPTYDAYFPIEQLADLIAVLTNLTALGLEVLSLGASVQARKVGTGFGADFIVEPRSATYPPPLLRGNLSTLADLIDCLVRLQPIVNQATPSDWDITKPYWIAFDGSDLVVPGSIHLGEAGPVWTSGTGAPTAKLPTGSLYSREDGFTGATLYVRVGNAWVAVA